MVTAMQRHRLERIMITRNRSAVPGDRVNPLYIN